MLRVGLVDVGDARRLGADQGPSRWWAGTAAVLVFRRPRIENRRARLVSEGFSEPFNVEQSLVDGP